MNTPFVAGALLFATITSLSAANQIHTFEKQILTTEFWAEGASYGDFNHDGDMDIVYGPFWYEGPNFTMKHTYAPATANFKLKDGAGNEVTIGGIDPHGYSKNFLAFTYDFNGDGWTDILILGFPGEDSSWYENPHGLPGDWKKHVILDVTDNESPTFTDITGDGKPEIVSNSRGYFGYTVPNWEHPDQPGTFHPITPKGDWQRFTHGMGVGDVNGDGRLDLLEKDGWWEQPASLAGDPVWTKHAFAFNQGGSHMYCYDIDGDGDNDVITGTAAHGYGLVWWENIKENGQFTFKQHTIINKEPGENKYGVAFSQLHAVDIIDMDGDGIADIVTGKRWWAHGPHGDAEPNAPAVLYWFKTVRNADKTVDFIPFKVDDDSGIGTQVLAGRVGKDKWPDIVIGNKKGCYIFTHKVRNASKKEYEASLPKPK